MVTEFVSKSFEDTVKFAKEFAVSLKPGDIVLLDGDLGAGKTVFSKGVVSALSNNSIVAVSPTFVLVNVYDTNPKVYHFDLYRIEDQSELDAIGAEEYFFGDGISLVEWPSRVEGFFPASSIKVNIKKLSDNERLITVERRVHE